MPFPPDIRCVEGLDDPALGPYRTLRRPEEILALRLCDLTCGSGAFLVQACRYMAERLVEAWALAEQAAPGQPLRVPEAGPSLGAHHERLLPRDDEERLAIARRLVAERCLYGVDVNPLAVEMAKLSLWLVTLQKSLPFTFLDHAIKSGDSLLGLHQDAQIRAFHLRPDRVEEGPREKDVTLRSQGRAIPVDRVLVKEHEIRIQQRREGRFDRFLRIVRYCDRSQDGGIVRRAHQLFTNGTIARLPFHNRVGTFAGYSQKILEELNSGE